MSPCREPSFSLGLGESNSGQKLGILIPRFLLSPLLRLALSILALPHHRPPSLPLDARTSRGRLTSGCDSLRETFLQAVFYLRPVATRDRFVPIQSSFTRAGLLASRPRGSTLRRLGLEEARDRSHLPAPNRLIRQAGWRLSDSKTDGLGEGADRSMAREGERALAVARPRGGLVEIGRSVGGGGAGRVGSHAQSQRSSRISFSKPVGFTIARVGCRGVSRQEGNSNVC